MIPVFFSDTWRDRWESTVQTNEQLIEALTQLARESGNPTTITEIELDRPFDPTNHSALRFFYTGE